MWHCNGCMDVSTGDEKYNVSQPLLFVNTETFQWQKNMRKIKEFLNIETAGKRIKD